MGFDDAAADRQPDAHPGVLGGEERLKQIGERALRKTVPRIRHADFEHVVGGAGARNDKLAIRALRHRLDRVAKQVDQDLLDLDAIRDDQVDRRIELEVQQDAEISRAHEAERARVLDHFADTFDAPFRFPARHEIPKTPDDLTGADRLLRRFVEAGPDLDGVDLGVGGQQPA